MQMRMDDSTVLWVIIGLLALGMVIVALLLARRRTRLRGLELRRQFGPEYERAVEQLGSRARAESVLAARAKRVHGFRFNELDAAERARFQATWSRIQAQFVDDPAVAAAGAHQLISTVMRARGYPVEDFEQRVADLSVEYPSVVQHYRAAHALATMHQGQLDTENLRQAVVHYRVLFAELLQEPNAMPASLRGAHA
jgi:hypothetical protein